ncbi:MAG: hypothetical protein WCO42_06955 [bacterium]
MVIVQVRGRIGSRQKGNSHLLGYTLLLKYPVSIVRLRRYLSTLADGGIPDVVTLPEDEDDLAAVQRHMERLVKLQETLEILKDTEEAFEAMIRLLEELRTLTRYASEPYLPSSPLRQGKPETRIIKV